MASREPDASIVGTYRLRGRHGVLGNTLSWLGLVAAVSYTIPLTLAAVLRATHEGFDEDTALYLGLAATGGLIVLAALSRLLARAQLWTDGTVDFIWLLRRRTLSVYDIDAIRWVRPETWRTCNAWRLEPFSIESNGRTMRLEAATWTFCELAEEIRRINPRVTLDLPEF